VVAHGGHAGTHIHQLRCIQQAGGLLEKGGKHVSKTGPAGAQFLLHANQLAHIAQCPLLAQFTGPFAHLAGQVTNAANTHHGTRRAQHTPAHLADALARRRCQIHCFRHLLHVVHGPFGGHGSSGETGPEQIFVRTALDIRKDRITDEIVLALFSDDHQIVHVKVKAERRRKVGQPVSAGPAGHRDTLVQFCVQRVHGLVRTPELLPKHSASQPFGDPLDDAADFAAVGGQRQAC
jgi:hypothetical protein